MRQDKPRTCDSVATTEEAEPAESGDPLTRICRLAQLYSCRESSVSRFSMWYAVRNICRRETRSLARTALEAIVPRL